MNRFSPADVEGILRQQGWLAGPRTPEIAAWIGDAAQWLGRQVGLESPDGGRETLTELLRLIFQYDAAGLLETKENQAVLAREGAREVIRELAHRVLEAGNIDSQRLRETVAALKAVFGSHGRRIFYPLRLALAGRVGEGELDRVILLLDPASRLGFSVPVKGTRERMLEFCAALD